MNRRAKVLLLGIIAVIVVAILIVAYFATQPEVKWWTPEKEMEKPDVDFEKLNDTIEFVRVKEDRGPLDLVAGNESHSAGFHVGVVLSIKWYTYYKDDYDEMRGIFTAWVERESGDYVLQKLVIHYTYGNEREDEYTAIHYTDPSVFEAANLSFNMARNHDPYEDDLYWNWNTQGVYQMVGVNKDAKNAGFYGVSFPIEILLEDPLSMNLSRAITFTVTAYYGHPSLLGWTDMHKLRTQVVLKIVLGGE